MEKELAEESEKTKKAREKLKKQLEKVDSEMNANALKEKAAEIHRRIARNAASRVILRTKDISLFDENRNTAEMSQRINKLALNLQKEFHVS